MCTNSTHTYDTEAVSTNYTSQYTREMPRVNASVVQREQRLGGLGGSALANKGGKSGGAGEMKVSEQSGEGMTQLQQGRDKLGY